MPIACTFLDKFNELFLLLVIRNYKLPSLKYRNIDTDFFNNKSINTFEASIR